MELLQRIINAIPVRDAMVEIPIIAVISYLVLRMLHGTRGASVFRGLVFVFTIAAVVISLAVAYFQLEEVSYFLKGFLTTPALVLVILFQPELRRGLIHFGQAPLVRRLLRGEEAMFDRVAEAASQLSRHKIGALIAFQREVGLEDFIEGGTKLDAEVTTELVMTIFWPDTPLSDGALVIQDNRMVAAGCLFPLSENPAIDKRLGTRHRAAIGITEDADAVCVIVSEETGIISLAAGGQIIRSLDKEQLINRLRHLLSGEKLPKKMRSQA
jgi:diadenylate cyclase